MTSTRFSQALGDVSKTFKSPQEIVAASDLDRQQKIDLLKQWETDLRLLMVASEENMGGGVPGGTGELLQAVLHCLAKLGASQRERQKAPTKSGG